jgi:hypothetical protein
MASQPQQDALFREGRMDLAKDALQKHQFKSLSAAADHYDVYRTTLIDRMKGKRPKRGSITSNRLLTPTEEAYLIQWILSIDTRGFVPTVSTVRDMASLLASQYGKKVTAGKNWASKFIDRNITLKSRFNRKYDY